MKKFFSKEVKIAVTVLVSLACLYWGLNYLKGINLFTPVNFYYAHFDAVDGLTDSAPVTINGYQVGLVREIIYDYDTGNLRVLLSLDKELKIPVNSEVIIKSDVLGTAQIELSLAKNTQYYEVGAEIAGRNAAGLMDNVSKELLPSVAAIMPNYSQSGAQQPPTDGDYGRSGARHSEQRGQHHRQHQCTDCRPCPGFGIAEADAHRLHDE